MRASRFILAGMVLSLPVVLGSCATMSKEECVAADWRVVGETDGAAGYDPQSRFAAHAKSCEKAGVVPDQTLWYQGFQVGVGGNLGLGGVVNQSVDPAEPFYRGGGHPAAIGIVRHVSPVKECANSKLFAGGRRRFRFRFAFGVINHDVGALASQA